MIWTWVTVLVTSDAVGQKMKRLDSMLSFSSEISLNTNCHAPLQLTIWEHGVQGNMIDMCLVEPRTAPTHSNPRSYLSASSLLPCFSESSWSREEEVLPSRLTPLLRPGLLSADTLPPPPAGRGLVASVCCFRVCSLARGMMSQPWGRCHTVRWVEAL